MHRWVALAAIIVLAGAAPLPATETLDLSTLTCKDFLASSKDDMATILTWLHGYYRDKDDPPVIDFAKLKADEEKISQYCTENPTHALLTATDKVLGADED